VNVKVIDKARKLKALAASSNPHEAALALKMMQTILIKHGLSEKDLEKDEFGRLMFLYSSEPWVRRCVNAIATLYLCRMAYSKFSASKNRYILIGSDENAEVVKEMCLSILDSIRKVSNRYGLDKRSFRRGAADRIAFNCRDLIESAKKGQLQDDCGEALVIGDLYQKTFEAIDKYLKEGFDVTEARYRKPMPVDKRSYMLGSIYGDTVELQKKIDLTTINE
jgi:hypothetical protein